MRSVPALPLAVLLLCSLLLAGCSGRPSAPALRDEPVYENAQEGFRFLAPEKWTQIVRASLPSGKLDRERLLVSYRRTDAGRPAQLEVSRADLDESASFAEHLAGPAFGSARWKPKGSPEALTVGGARGVRHVFAEPSGKDERVREVVAFRRGGRCYFFSGVYLAADTKARDEIRRSVNS